MTDNRDEPKMTGLLIIRLLLVIIKIMVGDGGSLYAAVRDAYALLDKEGQPHE